MVCLQTGNLEFWSRPILPQGSFAFAVVNYSSGGGPALINISLSSFAIAFSTGYNVTEAFDGITLGVLKPKSEFKISVNPSGVFMAVAVPV